MVIYYIIKMCQWGVHGTHSDGKEPVGATKADHETVVGLTWL